MGPRPPAGGDPVLSRRIGVETVQTQETEVREANEALYRAFESLDIPKMDLLWAQEPYVCCVHPGWSPRSGWGRVRDSWVMIFNHTRAMRFRVSDVQGHLGGSIARIVCLENIRADDGDHWVESQVVATYLFEMRVACWRMIHHQAPRSMPPARSRPLRVNALEPFLG